MRSETWLFLAIFGVSLSWVSPFVVDVIAIVLGCLALMKFRYKLEKELDNRFARIEDN